MKFYYLKAYFFVFVIGTCSWSFAQVNSSSSLLFNSERPSSADYNYESSRYGVRDSDIDIKPEVEDRQMDDSELFHQRADSQPKKQKSISKEVAPKGESLDPNQTSGNQPHVESEGQVAEAPMVEPPPENKDLKSLDPEDWRNHIIDVSFAPLYFYHEAKSDYWFRKMRTQSPGFAVDVDIWMSAHWGFHGHYMTGDKGSIIKSYESGDRTEVETQWVFGGLRYRRFMGINIDSPSITAGLDYYGSDFSVPSDETQRVSLETRGLRISAEIYLPEDKFMSWTFGLDYMPSLDHSEKATSLDLKSGDSNESSAVGLWVGQRWNLDYKNRFFWKLSHRTESNQFEGTANTADPKTLEKPSGVNVRNHTTWFMIGFTFGN